MSTNIHMLLEERVDGAWQQAKALVPNPDFGECGLRSATLRFVPVTAVTAQSYGFYGLIGNVRNMGVQPLDYGRGIPEDISVAVTEHAGAASASLVYLGESWFNYLSLRELVADDKYWSQTTLWFDGTNEVPVSYAEISGYFFYEFNPALVRYATNYRLDLDDVRLVFGFDR